jgi:hypothetical protein
MSNKINPKVDGNNILYHFLHKELFESDIWLFQMLSAKLVTSLGIWFHPKIYQQLPILLPFTVRDPACRKRKEGEVEAWGSPDKLGYLRDDNSLVKGLPKSLSIVSPGQSLYNNKRIGNGFVASHVWRQIRNSAVGANLASRDPVLNTFVPNLVWLPAQVAKLSDREGTFTQLYLQALSAKIFKDIPVPPGLSPFVEKAWSMIDIPAGIPIQGLPNLDDLSFFKPSQSFLTTRRKKIKEVIDALQKISKGQILNSKVITKRYGEGLPLVSPDEIMNRESDLNKYLDAVLAVE